MSQTLVKVGMKVITYVSILFYKPNRFAVYHKFLVQPVATSCLVIGICKVANRDTF